MRRIHRFLDLPVCAQWLLVKAALLLSAIRISLWVFPYSFLRPLLGRACKRSPRLSATITTPEDIALAVSRVGAVVPGGEHCLSQALALRILLNRRGIPIAVSFGVRRGANSGVMAHAWVEYNGSVLIGGTNLERFVRLAGPEKAQINPPVSASNGLS